MVIKRENLKLEHLLADTKEVNGCLEWQKTVDKYGYPKRYLDGDFNGKPHRRVFFFCHGYYPEVVRHSCDNRRCINPDHLLPGTTLQNVKDRNERRRTYNHRPQWMKDRAKEMRSQGAKFKEIAVELGLEKLKQVEYLLR